MAKSYFFLGSVFSGDGHTRVTMNKDEGYMVRGGSAKDHNEMVALTDEVSKRADRERPETPGEMRQILRESMNHVGMEINRRKL